MNIPPATWELRYCTCTTFKRGIFEFPLPLQTSDALVIYCPQQ
jgi:hypothetical protein